MATIAENLTRIQQAKADIKTAIEAKGVTVPSSATIDTYDDYVSQISGGGGAATPSNLSDWTYDSFGKITSAAIRSGVTSLNYSNGFNSCGSLSSVTIPNSVTSIGSQAFHYCGSLTTIDIPNSVTTLGQAFQHCGSLTSCTIGSGITSIAGGAFADSALNNITINATTPPSGGSANYGIFVNTPISDGFGHIYVPEESVDLYKASSGFSAYSAVITCIGCSTGNEYFTTVALGLGTIEFNSGDNTLEYSTDSGSTWNTGNSVNVNEGDEILWRCNSPSAPDGIGTFSSDCPFEVQGNIMSLLYGDNFVGETMLNLNNQFAHLFSGCYNLVSAENLALPATILSNYCYYNMFYGCTSLTTAPVLPATTLTDGCYSGMFQDCTSLNSITCLATDISAMNCTSDWVNGVASSGTFTKDANMNDWQTCDYSGIPCDWTVEDYSF